MTQLWLVPVDERSFQQTLAEPINLSNQTQKPDEFPDRARVWGVRTDPEQGIWERNRRNLERMETGDPLLIYRNSTSRYQAKGQVGPFWHTEYVRDEFWNGGPAIDVFAVEEYEEIDVDREDVNNVLGYESNFWPQGLWRVSDNRPTERAIRQFEI
ncbi:hypothetical protein [Haloplanus aerogenes]|uniref:EVE domain-containing protein n=1 Tax=Haloplanus aerogenes TaxID=660522 RepID=A0A3M0DTP3_9EURY|nr:hypothetical protein [Haloplanus aerogenes]AZH25669.1 hypothetical protein DU502_09885 [Haloplanus aerogenes]RMB25399.1 hypothetical protein ATH50_0488 [Haloplanus aerogenes]